MPATACSALCLHLAPVLIIIIPLAQQFPALQPLRVLRGPQNPLHHLLGGNIPGRRQQVHALLLRIVRQVVVPERHLQHLEHVQLRILAQHNMGQRMPELRDIVSFLQILAYQHLSLEDLLEIRKLL